MADVATPAAACAGGVFSITCLSAFGFDPQSMVWGLMGVVIVQTVLPRSEDVKPLAVAGVAVGSTLLANVGSPFLAPAVVSVAPDAWAWIKAMDPVHVKSAAAALLGGFAQPILLWARSFLPKPKLAKE